MSTPPRAAKTKAGPAIALAAEIDAGTVPNEKGEWPDWPPKEAAAAASSGSMPSNQAPTSAQRPQQLTQQGLQQVAQNPGLLQVPGAQPPVARPMENACDR